MAIIKRVFAYVTVISRNFNTELSNFVPKHSPVTDSDVRLLEEFLRNSVKIVVLTGAGISTESGK